MRSAWKDLAINLDEICPAPAMISPPERKLFYWLAKEYYRGLGEIVECGTFLGASNHLFANGLRANAKVKDKEKRIHSYDLFQNFHLSFKPWMDEIGVAFGESFLPYFENSIRGHREMVEIYPGDLLEKKWCGRPVEILFVDIAHTWELGQHVIDQFFRSLIPGVSIVVHQDYFYQNYPWLHIAMEHFMPYFSIVDTADTTVVFLLQRSIPEEALAKRMCEYSAKEKIALMDRSIMRFKGTAKGVVELLKAKLFDELHGRNAAQAMRDDVLKRYRDDKTVQWRGQQLFA